MKVTLEQCSLRFMGEKLWKSQCFWVASTAQRETACRNHKCSQCSSLSSISMVLFTLNSLHKVKHPIKLLMWKYWRDYVKLHVWKGLNFGPAIRLSTMTWPSLQNALCQEISGPKIDYWNGTPALFPWFDSEWLLILSKNKVCLKGAKISRHWRHPRNVKTAVKPIPQQEFQKVCNSCRQHRWA